MKLADVLSKLRNTYKSIDLYVASAKHKDEWLSLLTLIRFSKEESDYLNKQIEGNEKLTKFGKGKLVRLNRKAFSLEYLDKLVSNLSLGFIETENEAIRVIPVDLMNNFDLTLCRSQSPQENWGSFSSTRGRIDESPYNLASFYDNLKPELIPLGSADIYAAIRDNFDVDYNSSTRIYDLAVEAPIYARITNLELLGTKLKVKVRYHQNVDGLILHYNQHSYIQSLKTTEPKVYDSSMGNISQSGEFMDWDVELDELNPTQQSYDNVTCDVSLYIPNLNDEISIYDRKITEMLTEKKLLETNPLARVFVRFCTSDQLLDMLANPMPGGKDNFKLSDSDNFERAVQWLFALHGFQAIWLGKDHEVIRDSINRSSGSADILCYNKDLKTLALVSCKTSVPKAEHIDEIKNLANKIGEDLKDLGIKTVAIVITSKPSETVRQDALQNGVDVIDITELKKIISKLYEIPPSPSLFLRDLSTFTFRPDSFYGS